jgi:hypothetical protein
VKERQIRLPNPGPLTGKSFNSDDCSDAGKRREGAESLEQTLMPEKRLEVEMNVIMLQQNKF